MDLELNFAAPPANGGGGARRQNGGGGAPVHWKERMKGQQAKRRKQGRPAKVVTMSTKDDRNIRDLTSQDAAAGPSKPSAAASSSQTLQKAASAATSITPGSTTNSTRTNERRILAQQDDDGEGDVLKPSGNAAKRQVISSLFSNLPKLQPRDNATATKDENAAPSVLTPSNAPSMGDNFEAMPIRKELVAHLTTKMALQHPTTIQKLAVPFLCDPASSKKDALLQAQTGSGKTLSYLLPIIQDLLQMSERFKEMGKPMQRSVGTLAIVLVPTRELAAQIFEVASKLLGFASGDGASHRWITPGLLTGGAHRQHEKARLRKGIPLLIATPGRLLDHLEATKAFRIAGESIRLPADLSRRRKGDGTTGGLDSDDEFAYEDQGYQGGAAANDEDAISSDEDFENMAKSRSHRRNGEMPDRTPKTPPADPQLALRWLVLDEADRLMDMGFEPQISSIVKLLETRLDKRKAALARASNRGAVTSRLSGQIAQQQRVAERRTILCSATVEEKVEKLAGIALKDPLLIKGDDEQGAQTSKPNDGQNATSDSTAATKYAPPTQLSQYFSVISPKLRFVALVALLRQVLLSSSAKKKRQKILVFMSCTDSVDFHWNSMSGMHMGRDAAVEKKVDDTKQAEKLASKSALLPGTPVYRLHGSLDLQTRLTSLKAFSSNTDESAVLFCTSVAARGLDVQDVNCVIQYDLPTEGGVNEYIHRVGRTARAGAQGQAWAFLLPSETGWVDWAEAGMQKSSEADAKNVTLVERDVDGLLKVGFGGGDAREYETRATDVQMAFERWVSIDEANARLAKKAFSSHVRAYATHPSEEKQFFHVKNLHLGHLAKAFGLREAPAGIGGGGGQKSNRGNTSKPVETKPTVGRKRKRNQPALDAAAAAIAAAQESASEEDRPNRKPQIPRSGRALDGKGLHGPKGSVRSDYNIAGADAIEAMLNKKRRT